MLERNFVVTWNLIPNRMDISFGNNYTRNRTWSAYVALSTPRIVEILQVASEIGTITITIIVCDISQFNDTYIRLTKMTNLSFFFFFFFFVLFHASLSVGIQSNGNERWTLYPIRRHDYSKSTWLNLFNLRDLRNEKSHISLSLSLTPNPLRWNDVLHTSTISCPKMATFSQLKRNPDKRNDKFVTT